MSLLSATEDFRNRTLATWESVLEKLTYVAGLRNSNGTYSHWGMERTHGAEAAQHSLSANHSEVWLEVLQTPLPQLVAHMEAMDTSEREDLLAKLRAAMPPQELRGGTVSHFNSTVLALQLVLLPKNARRAA